ncbi:MAG TPA: hypothetical protein VMX77_01330, partial [Candidatus Bathyarchaeia archaeon]|nr:hypothetical protein [Candidatus Bathyarchaeia archaeon]
WLEIYADGTNDNFIYGEQGQSLITDDSPQTNPDGTRKHAYDLTLLSTSGQIKALSEDSDPRIGDVWCGTTVNYVLPIGTIKGTVYEGNSCPVSGEGVGGGRVQVVGPESYGPIDVSPDGTYEFKDIDVGTYTVMMTTPPPDYTADVVYCPTQQVDLAAGEEETANLGLTKIEDPWFQTRGGDVHAQGGLTDPIPSLAADGPYCSLKGDGGYPGVVSYGDSYTFGEDGSASEDSFGWLANSSSKSSFYPYFDSLVDDYREETPSLADGKPAEGIYKLTGDQAIDDDWSVASGEKLVILVTGNLSIEANITVVKGGFLGLIVSGDITVDSGVTTLEGVFVGSSLTVASVGDDSEVGLSAAGSFVGGNIILQRDFTDLRNNTTPGEVFIFRPDLWINAPRELWGVSYSWQELSP